MRAVMPMRRLLSSSLPPPEVLDHSRPAAEVGRRPAPRRHAVQGQGQLGGGAAGGPGVDGEGVPVDVVQRVAGEVVAGVLGGAGAGEEARRRDAELKEADVVGAGAKGSGGKREISAVFCAWDLFCYVGGGCAYPYSASLPCDATYSSNASAPTPLLLAW